jgi:ornithine--oxo-acid transaminase
MTDPQEALENEDVVAYLVEPVQEGAVFPADDYLEEVRKLCTKEDVLLIVDELDTCLGRCGALLASYHHRIRPDVLVIGRALGAGITPVTISITFPRIWA